MSFVGRKAIVIIAALCSAAIVLPQSAHALSGCERCGQYGDCSAAFHSGPGQYCGQWVDYSTGHKRPCCCPYNSVCKISSSSCKCHVIPSGAEPAAPYYYPPPPSPPSSSHHYKHRIKPDIIDMLGFAIALTLFFCCCCLCVPKFIRGFKRATSGAHDVPFTPYDDHHTNPPPVNPDYYPYADAPAQKLAVPAAAVPTYGATAMPAAPGGAGGAGANLLSGLGGLAAGTVLGNMIAHRMDRNEPSAAANAASAGGYDILGDSAGDTAGMAAGGNIDTGGLDFAGDDGGDFGGDFDGDS